MKIPISFCVTFLLLIWGQTECSAKPAAIKNAQFSVTENQGEQTAPKEWTVEGDKSKVVAWDLNQGEKVVKTVSISRGASLINTVTLAPLHANDTKLKGIWSGLLMIDTYGTAFSDSALQVSILQNGKQLLTQDIKVKFSRDNKLARTWAYLSPELITALMAAEAELRIVGMGKSGVVLGGVEVCRLLTGGIEAKTNTNISHGIINVASLGLHLLVENHQRVSTVYGVKKGSVAEQAGLKNGDVLAAINDKRLHRNSKEPDWEWFNKGHDAVLGRAILDGFEGENPTRAIKLSVFREGKPSNISLALPDVFLEEDFFMKPSGEKMRQDMIGYLLKNQRADGSVKDPIQTCFAALSLLAEKDPKYAPQIVKAVNWMLNKYPDARSFGKFGNWYASYVGTVYCEYYLATGDKRVLPRIRGIHDWVMTGVHTSSAGLPCVSHDAKDVPYWRNGLMAPACHLVVFDGLAQKCGLHTQLWDILLPYSVNSWSDPSKKGGKGFMGYNHASPNEKQCWSRTGLFALACGIRGEREDMQNALTLYMEKNYCLYQNSHAYGEPGGAWGLISLASTRPEAYKKIMNALRWKFALSWEPGYGMRFTMPAGYAPYMQGDELFNSAYPLVFSASKKSLFITGGKERNWLDVSAIPIPLTNVLLHQKRNGKVWMETRIAGNPIYYTTDGSEPAASSTLYKEPFDLSAGGTVKAVSIVAGKMSKVAKGHFAPFNPKLRVIAASGHKDPEEAIRRAEFSIDNSSTSWYVERGLGSRGYPVKGQKQYSHYVVYDLGELRKVESIRFGQGGYTTPIGECRVFGSKDEAEVLHPEKTKPTLLGEAKWDKPVSNRELTMSSGEAVRYLRVEFVKTVGEWKGHLIIMELVIKSNVAPPSGSPSAPHPTQGSERP